MKRGEIYYINSYKAATGSEQSSNRPAIIVSNDINNRHSTTVEVVYLTTKPKKFLPTHVSISSATLPSTALCEQVTTVSTTRLQKLLGECSPEEMEAVNKAMMISLGIEVV